MYLCTDSGGFGVGRLIAGRWQGLELQFALPTSPPPTEQITRSSLTFSNASDENKGKGQRDEVFYGDEMVFISETKWRNTKTIGC